MLSVHQNSCFNLNSRPQGFPPPHFLSSCQTGARPGLRCSAISCWAQFAYRYLLCKDRRVSVGYLPPDFLLCYGPVEYFWLFSCCRIKPFSSDEFSSSLNYTGEKSVPDFRAAPARPIAACMADGKSVKLKMDSFYTSHLWKDNKGNSQKHSGPGHFFSYLHFPTPSFPFILREQTYAYTPPSFVKITKHREGNLLFCWVALVLCLMHYYELAQCDYATACSVSALRGWDNIK